MPAIGIDFGTTSTRVGVFRNGKVEIITNEQGHQTTPSRVAFTDSGLKIGELAMEHMSIDPKNTVFDVKRFIGRKIGDVRLQRDMEFWPFEVIDASGKVKVQVEYKGETKAFSPEEVISFIFTKVKETAESHLGDKVTDAVITVPAFFTDAQRTATKEAGILAGLNVLQLVNEPTSAALAYCHTTSLHGEKKIMIFDLGGGKCDVSILNVADGSVIEVLSTEGDAVSAGNDFDQNLADYCVSEFRKSHGKDISHNKGSLTRLIKECERAKITLSSNMEATIKIDSLFEGIDFQCNIGRSQYEGLCSDTCDAIESFVTNVLRDLDMRMPDIHDVVLVGGSTRIPQIQNLLRRRMNRGSPNQSLNPDEAVVCGAALQAALLSGSKSELTKEYLLLDIVPHSLGISTGGGLMTKIVQRNTTLPIKYKQVFSTTTDNQSVIAIEVFEGDRQVAKDNNFLGRFEISGMLPAPRGVPKIEGEFSIDTSGILNITATDTSDKKSESIAIKRLE